MAKLLPDRRNAALSLGRYGPLGGGLRSGGADNPSISVTGGVVTYFTRGGVDYTQIAFYQNGGLRVWGEVTGVNTALGAGGGSGGRGGAAYRGSPGSAGGLIELLGGVLTEGIYDVVIGKGGTSVATGNAPGVRGDDSVLTRPDGSSDRAIGGAGGTVTTKPADGGSGAGEPGYLSALGFSLGTPGQGNQGGLGLHHATDTALRVSGGSGGADGPGGDAALGVRGAAGLGRLLGWIETPETVCSGALGTLSTDGPADRIPPGRGSGTQGANSYGSLAAGDGFLFIVFPSDKATIRPVAWLMSTTGDITTDDPGDNSTPLNIFDETDSGLTISIDQIYVVADATDYVTLEAG